MSRAIALAVPAVTAAVLAYVLSPVAARLAIWLGAVDMPGARKIHNHPIPRLGGLAVVASCVAGLFVAGVASAGGWLLSRDLALGLGLGLIPILGISIVDDIRGVRAGYKFLAHGVGAAIAVGLGVTLGDQVHLFGSSINLGLLRIPLSMLWLMGVTNAFNIIDGLDGLSAGLALISAVAMAAVFVLVGQVAMGGAALVLVGALAGFLPYNVHPARLFLGDTGATAIGFCLAVFALKGGSTLSTGFAALLPVFILGLPIADTLITMARRTIGRLENHAGGVFEPDRNHIHHRLLAIGIDHGRAVLMLYGAGLVFAAAAFISVFLNAREAGLFVVALILAGFLGLHRLGYAEFAFLRRGTVLKVYEMPAVKRGMFVVFVDIFLAAVTAYLAVGLKTDQWSLSAVHDPVLDLATTFAPVTVVVFWWSGMYRGSWRVAGLQDLTRCCKAVAIVTVAGATLVRLLTGDEHALSLFAIYGAVNLLLTASLRVSYVVLENTQLRASNRGIPVLIYGAGGKGVAAVRELFQNSDAGLRPIGFIDDDPAKRHKLVSGLPVFGTERELKSIIRAEKAEALLIATGKISAERLQLAADVCAQMGASIFRLDIWVRRIGEGGSAQQPAAVPAGASAAAAPVLQSLVEALRLLGTEPCPSCDSRDVHRSKARTLYERIRKTRTRKRLFRCHQCGWRGWLAPFDSWHATDGCEVHEVDLSGIDNGLDAAPLISSSGDR